MEKQKNFYDIIEEIGEVDKRYKIDAYEFVMQALHFTQEELKREGHISGQELLDGISKFAIEQYGPMAKTVLSHWGITKTEDFGNIVFNMVDKKLLSKNETDSIGDFKNVYDFESVFSNVFRNTIIKNI